MSKNILKKYMELGIKNLLISYSDFQGISRSKLVPIHQVNAVKENGAGFAGYASYLDLTPADEDVLAYPDFDSLIQLPWNKEVAWVPSDLYLGKNLLHSSPRNCLKKVRENAQEKGFRVKTGVECEFFLLDKDQLKQSDPLDRLEKPCYDQRAIMRRYALISQISEYMYELGWEPYQSDHEDANGQFEMNWKYDETLITADRHTFFKFMVHSIAEEHGFNATFMPKPFTNLTGNGCHVHVSLWHNENEKNLFINDSDDTKLSLLGQKFMHGILKTAKSLAAITNPSVNSYKRLNSEQTISGSTWCSNEINFGGNDRTKLIRQPANDRFEYRGPDGLANPYLLQAGITAAGLLGIASKSPIQKQLVIDKLPSTLDSAIMALLDDNKLSEVLGKDLIKSYCKIKQQEWTKYMSSVSEWEINQYLSI